MSSFPAKGFWSLSLFLSLTISLWCLLLSITAGATARPTNAASAAPATARPTQKAFCLSLFMSFSLSLGGRLGVRALLAHRELSPLLADGHFQRHAKPPVPAIGRVGRIALVDEGLGDGPGQRLLFPRVRLDAPAHA